MDLFAGTVQSRSPVYGMSRVIASGHSLSSLAGLRVLAAGGSVADSMIAASAVLTVVLPHATSLGGDAFILYHEAATGKTMGLNASGPAPSGAVPERFPDGMVPRGPLAATVPGIVRGWEALHQRYGRLPWQALLAPALNLAEEGHPVSRVLSAGLDLYREDVEQDPGLRATYLPNGRPFGGGEVLRLPALARTLRSLSSEGADAFYEGPIAQSICAASGRGGGLLKADDLRAYQPEWVESLSSEYRGFTVEVMPPNSYGALLLLQLNGLSGLKPSELARNDVQRLASLITAYRAAFSEGARQIADPRVHPVPVDTWLGAETTVRMQRAVSEGSSRRAGGGLGGTACIAIADREGNAVCAVQSVYTVFGSAFLDPGTGVLLNNRMTGFSNDPTEPNAVAPGKRPAHTLCPAVVLKDGRVRYVLSSPGGPSQTAILAQILTNLVDRGMELSEAVDQPRWSVDAKGDLLLESRYPQDIKDQLERLGIPTSRAPGSSYYGSAKCLEVRPDGVLAGVADLRREAFAAGE